MNLHQRTVAAAALALIPGATLGASALASPAAPRSAAGAAAACRLELANQIDSSGAPVTVASEQGEQYGRTSCGTKLGRGVIHTSFSTAESGDSSGRYQMYFRNGTLRGAFILHPEDGQNPSTGSFGASSYSGTIAIAGGTGALKGSKGTGKLTCASPDSVHVSCTARLRGRL